MPQLRGEWTGTLCLSEPQAGRRCPTSPRARSTNANPRSDRSTASAAARCGSRAASTKSSATSSTGAGEVPHVDGSCRPNAWHFAVQRAAFAGRCGGPRRRAQRRQLAGLTTKLGYRATWNCALISAKAASRPKAARVRSVTWSACRAKAWPDVPHDERRAYRRWPGAWALGYAGYLHALDYARNVRRAVAWRRARIHLNRNNRCRAC